MQYVEDFLGFFKPIWNSILVTTGKWMPNGFLPKTVVWIVTEFSGALLCEKAVSSTLDSANSIALAHIPGYRKIPLISALALATFAARSSKTALTITALSLPLLLTQYNLEELEESVSSIAGSAIYFLGGMFASIHGGFIALTLTHSTIKYSNYRSQMVEHAIAGQIFEISTAVPSCFVFKIVRAINRAVFQTVAYNRKPLFQIFRQSARKTPTCGIFTPGLSRFLYEKFQTIDTKSVAENITQKIVPYFMPGPVSFFTTVTTENILRTQLAKIVEKKTVIVTLLQRSLIRYYTDLSSQNAIPKKGFMHLLGNNAVWSDENSKDFAQFLTTQLVELGVFLFGKKVYSQNHLKSVTQKIEEHTKPFCNTFLQTLTTSESSIPPLSEEEELQLLQIIHEILFNVAIQPLLPKTVVSCTKKTTRKVTTAVGMLLHIIQGKEKKVTIRDKRALTNLDPDYFASKETLATIPEPADEFIVVSDVDSDFEELAPTSVPSN